jgi:hypothetical protein
VFFPVVTPRGSCWLPALVVQWITSEIPVFLRSVPVSGEGGWLGVADIGGVVLGAMWWVDRRLFAGKVVLSERCMGYEDRNEGIGRFAGCVHVGGWFGDGNRFCCCG